MRRRRGRCHCPPSPKSQVVKILGNQQVGARTFRQHLRSVGLGPDKGIPRDAFVDMMLSLTAPLNADDFASIVMDMEVVLNDVSQLTRGPRNITIWDLFQRCGLPPAQEAFHGDPPTTLCWC